MKEYNPTETIVFDRAISIKTKEDIKAFIDNPQKFLESIGALQGLPGFNGLIDHDGNKISSPQEYFDSALKSYDSNEGDNKGILCYHIPIPYRWACHWMC